MECGVLADGVALKFDGVGSRQAETADLDLRNARQIPNFTFFKLNFICLLIMVCAIPRCDWFIIESYVMSSCQSAIGRSSASVFSRWR